MSLNGLDDPKLKEAYETAIAEAGRWFLLKYASRDEVELLGSGSGGVVELRHAVEGYQEASPLYGFLRYRRRNVLIKYLPEGCSRLIQARVAVHFNAVCEQFSPYDTQFDISTAEDIKDSKLSAACSLHAATGSNSSTASSQHRKHLMEIAEEEEDEQPTSKRQSLIRDEKNINVTAAETAEADRPKTASGPEPVTLNAELATSPEHSKFSAENTSDVPQFVGALNEAAPAGSSRRMSSQSGRSDVTPYSTGSYAFMKPRVKLAARPSLEKGGIKPQTAGNFRPVASIPAGYKLFGKGSSSASSIRKTRKDSVSSQASGISEMSFAATLPIPEEERFAGGRPATSSGVSTKSTGTTKSTMTPEKARLKKAMLLREKKRKGLVNQTAAPVTNAPSDVQDEASEGKPPEAEATKVPLEPTNDGDGEKNNDRNLSELTVNSTPENNVPCVKIDSAIDIETSPASTKISGAIGDGEDADRSTKASSVSESTEQAEQDQEMEDEAASAAAATVAAADVTPKEIQLDQPEQGAEEATPEQNTPKIDEPAKNTDESINENMAAEEPIMEPAAGVEDAKAMDAAPEESKDEEENDVQYLPATTYIRQSRIYPQPGIPMHIEPLAGETSNAIQPEPLLEATPESPRPEAESDSESKLPATVEVEEMEGILPSTDETDGGDTPKDTTTHVMQIPKSKFSSPDSQSAAVAEDDVSPIPVEVDSLGVTGAPADEFVSASDAGQGPAQKRRAFVEPIRTDLSVGNSTSSTSSSGVGQRGQGVQGPAQGAVQGVVQGAGEQDEQGEQRSRPTSLVQTETNFSDDESLLEELQSATVLEARPMLVAKTPLTPVFPTSIMGGSSSPPSTAYGNGQGGGNGGSQTAPGPGAAGFSKPQMIRTASNPVRGNLVAPPTDVSQSSARSVSQGGAVYLHQVTQQAANGALAKKSNNMGSSIAQRIKALETLSADSAGSSPSNSRPSSTFFSVKKGREPSRSPSVADRTTSLTRTSPSAAASREHSPDANVTTRDRSGSMASRLSMFEPVASPPSSSHAPRGRPESISVTAKIVRDDDAENTDLRESPLVVDHHPYADGDNSNAVEPLQERRGSQASLSRHGSNSPSHPPSTLQNSSFHRLSISSRRSLSKDRETIVSPVDVDDDGDKPSRAERLMRRLSSFSNTSRGKGSAGISPTVKEEAPQPVASKPAPATLPRAAPTGRPTPQQRPATTAGEPSITSQMGDVNVQFPDTLLWKRRNMSLDSQGFLILAMVQSSLARAPGGIRRFHMSEFRQPYIPDVEVQELPNSVCLDLVEGGAVQVACEDRPGQTRILQGLREAHAAHETKFGM
ncbi:hypothetical protein N3K66_007565 [Trichothecium roseum]|uniref:Uncharacterized protein n=1 Tax=Trichothecium roseum TaxID=47278 RepID=A0ACC0UU90_9HYPO|nr:hypothetical protein N3K66_007565 [Trichothecium roseum]